MKTSVLFVLLILSMVRINPAYTSEKLNAEFLNSRGMHELEAGNNRGAAEYFLQAIKANPSKKNYYNNLAAAYIRISDFYSAEQQLSIAITIDPNYTKALSNMSVVMFRTGRYKEAYEYYKRAEQSDPSYTGERFEKKRVLARLKEESKRNPDDRNLKIIIRQIESSGE
ncbi:MAG: tetratricopeptide repeat protein [Spirochaetes bacterium]|nr:tetratricopeptide repeat protein [Spirochaetota bacterium]